MVYRVIGFDPGGTTGWATYTANRIWDPEFERYLYSNELWSSGQIEGTDQRAQLVTLLENQRVDEYFVVCERFVDRRNNKGRDAVAIEHEVTIRNWCNENEVNYVGQMASEAKTFVKDANLKRLTLWVSGHKWRHAKDALRHVLRYLCVKCDRADLLAIGWPR